MSNNLGLDTVEAPRRLKRWTDKYTPDRIAAIVKQLRESDKWLSDSEEHCDGRSQAYYRAECLIDLVIENSDIQKYELQRRTWPENGGYRWAIKRRT